MTECPECNGTKRIALLYSEVECGACRPSVKDDPATLKKIPGDDFAVAIDCGHGTEVTVDLGCVGIWHGGNGFVAPIDRVLVAMAKAGIL